MPPFGQATDGYPWVKASGAVHTEAVFSVKDPLPGLYEIALLPYLAVKRGL